MTLIQPRSADAFVRKPDAHMAVVLVYGPDTGLVSERVKALVKVSVDDVEAPGDDPREYEAANHNLRQVQRELELTQALWRVMVEKARCEYELSASWRLTKPLRAAASRVRSLRSR